MQLSFACSAACQFVCVECMIFHSLGGPYRVRVLFRYDVSYTGMKLVLMVLKERFSALLSMFFACCIVGGTVIIFEFSLSRKGRGIVMACSTKINTHFTSEQS